MMTMTSALTHI